MVWATVLPLIFYLEDIIKVAIHNLTNGNTGKLRKRINRSRFLVDFLEFCQTCKDCPDDNKISIERLAMLQKKVRNLELNLKSIEEKKESMILPPSSSLPQFFDFKDRELMVGYADYSISPPVVKEFRGIVTRKINSSNPKLILTCFKLVKKLYDQLLKNTVIGPLMNKQVIFYHKGSVAIFLAVKNMLNILKLEGKAKKRWETKARSLFNGSDLDVGIVFLEGKKKKNLVYVTHLVNLLVEKFMYENRNYRVFSDAKIPSFLVGNYRVSPYKSHSYKFKPSYPGDLYRTIHCISKPESTFVTFNEVSFMIGEDFTHFNLCRLKTSLKVEGVVDPNYLNTSHGELLDVSISRPDDAYGCRQAEKIHGNIKFIDVSLD